MPATADNFSAFAQMALKTISSGLLLARIKPSLALIYRYMVGEPEALLIQAGTAYFLKHTPGYEKELQVYERAENEMPRRADTSMTAIRAKAFIRFYREKVQSKTPSSDLEGLITFCESNKEWRSKMLGGLMPVLDALTAGHLGKLLSPDYADATDPRPIIDFQMVVDNRLVFYVALDSMSDQVTGSAIGSLMISDLTAVAGAEMNYGNAEARREVYIFIDEVNELANDPLVQLLNKSRSAGFRLTLALQSIFSDLAARMGNEHKATQVLDNINNLIVLRLGNPETRKRIADQFGDTMIRTLKLSQGNTQSSKDPTDMGGSASESLEQQLLPMIPQDVLGKLPNLEYFAWNAGGRIVKGRLPILNKTPVDLAALMREHAENHQPYAAGAHG
jgi:conjugal transfer pilus assembly protein TraD